MKLREAPARWLVTGAAGFIGSHLVERLLELGQRVTGLDNFSTGHRRNLDDVHRSVGDQRWGGFRFVDGDICDDQACMDALTGTDIVLHQAALGSVPRSIAEPMRTHNSNLTGFVNMLLAARRSGVKRFVYAASSSTYGDHPALPKTEDVIGRPLSPYAVTKLANELYASVFAMHYGMEIIGLRYFNVFGPRQDPEGAYAAVIPRWIAQRMEGQQPVIFGDGETSRDFCYVANVVQANLLAAASSDKGSLDQVYNVAVGESTSLNSLLSQIDQAVARLVGKSRSRWEPPRYEEFRAGDVRHSLADISKARKLLGYEPTYIVSRGLEETVDWFARRTADSSSAVNRG